MNAFGDAGAISLADNIREAHHPVLQVLRLAGNAITDVGAERLAKMMCKNASIQLLGLSANRIGDAGASLLLDSLQNRPLFAQVLLGGNSIFSAEMTARIDTLRSAPAPLVMGHGRNSIIASTAATVLASKRWRRESARRASTQHDVTRKEPQPPPQQQPAGANGPRRSRMDAGGSSSSSSVTKRNNGSSGGSAAAIALAAARSRPAVDLLAGAQDHSAVVDVDPLSRATDHSATAAPAAAPPSQPLGRRNSNTLTVARVAAVSEAAAAEAVLPTIGLGTAATVANIARRKSYRNSLGGRRPSYSSQAGGDDSADAQPPVAIPEGEPESLPGGQEALPAMRTAVRELHDRFQQRTELKRFENIWLKRDCQQLFLTYVWLAICGHVLPQDDATSQEGRKRFFRLLAAKHTALFASSSISGETKDVLAWFLPEALSRAALVALGAHFPQYAVRPILDTKGVVETSDKAKATADALRETLFDEYVSWNSGFGAPTKRQGSVSVRFASGGHTMRDESPVLDARGERVSMPVVLEAPTVARKEKKDVSQCSPLVRRWLESREGGVRQGSSSARGPHRVRCSLPDANGAQTARAAAALHNKRIEEPRAGAPAAERPNRPKTYREVSKEASELATRLARDFARGSREAMAQAASEKAQSTVHIDALRQDERRALQDVRAAREYANYLVSVAHVEAASGDGP